MAADESEIESRLDALNLKVAESKKTLESLTNDVSNLFDQLAPRLIDEIKRLREHRMAVIREVQESLGALREIRKFFLEADYQQEVERLERFVGLCKELEAVKRSGILDAVADTMVSLMLKQKTKEEA